MTNGLRASIADAGKIEATNALPHALFVSARVTNVASWRPLPLMACCV